jgi:uncharacterized membrane protein YeaQ/YmgE (transglycosylase-associated protein family)
MNLNTQQLVTMAVVGIVAGFLAGMLLGGGGLVWSLIVGLLGGVVGGWRFNAAGWKLTLGNDLVEQIIVSAVGAIVLVLLARLVA